VTKYFLPRHPSIIPFINEITNFNILASLGLVSALNRVGDKVVDDGVESDRVDATKLKKTELKTDRIEVRQS
jgi:hypothetical protein